MLNFANAVSVSSFELSQTCNFVLCLLTTRHMHYLLRHYYLLDNYQPCSCDKIGVVAQSTSTNLTLTGPTKLI